MPHSANTGDVSLLDVFFLWHLQQRLNLKPRNVTDIRLVCEEVICADQPQRLIHFCLMQTEMRSLGLFSNKIKFLNPEFFVFFFFLNSRLSISAGNLQVKINLLLTEKLKRHHLVDKLEIRSGWLWFLKNGAKIKIPACKYCKWLIS